MCSLLAVLHARFNDRSRYMQLNETIRNKEKRRQWCLLKWNKDMTNPVPSLNYAPVNKFIIYVTIYEQKTAINKLSRSKTPKTQVEGFTHMRIASDLFSRHQPGPYVCARKNLVYLRSFANVSVPVRSIIPLWQLTAFMSCHVFQRKQLFEMLETIFAALFYCTQNLCK